MRKWICLIIILMFSFQIRELQAGERNWDGTLMEEATVVKKSRLLDRSSDFLIASGILLAATVYDVEMTFQAGRHGAKEGNPWARSFVEKGKAETYGYALAIDAATLGIAYLMFKSKDPDIQRKWIVFPAIGIAGHTIGGTINLFYVF
jgi:hypothetical protein